MPQDNARSKRELVAELQAARQRVVENETLEHDLKQTLTALEKAARKSENILNRMIEGYISLDRDMTVLSFNNAAERILGRKAEDVLGRTLFDAFPEARAALSEETFTAVLKNRKNLAFETHFNAGPYANWYDVRVYPEQDGLSAYFLVTTERKRAEEKLRAGAQTLQQLLDATPDRIMLIDLEENILTINEAAAKGINTTQEEIKGKNVHAYFPPNIIEARRKIYMEAMRTGTRRRYVDERQGITWESIYHPVRNLDGEIDRLAVYARDITEQRRNEEALRRARNATGRWWKAPTISSPGWTPRAATPSSTASAKKSWGCLLKNASACPSSISSTPRTGRGPSGRLPAGSKTGSRTPRTSTVW